MTSDNPEPRENRSLHQIQHYGKRARGGQRRSHDYNRQRRDDFAARGLSARKG